MKMLESCQILTQFIDGTVIQYDIAATVAKALGLTNIPQSWRGIPIDVFA